MTSNRKAREMALQILFQKDFHENADPRELFNAFELCPFDAVKVILLGQDPYHGPGQAHGLSFSVERYGAFD